jgi:hypothetical protein
VCVCVCIYARMRLCLYMQMRMRVYVYVYMYVCVCVYFHTFIAISNTYHLIHRLPMVISLHISLPLRPPKIRKGHIGPPPCHQRCEWVFFIYKGMDNSSSLIKYHHHDHLPSVSWPFHDVIKACTTRMHV